jgi:hypothetical protein
MKVANTVPRENAKFDFVPPSVAPIGSAKMTVVLVKPVYVSQYDEFLISPFSEMAVSMGNDFEELLTAKGFTIRGPFNSRDEMVYNDKINSSFILEVQIDLKPEISNGWVKRGETRAANLLFASEPLAYTFYRAKGIVVYGGNLILTAISPQYGEKIWKKSIALDKMSFPYEGEKEFFSQQPLSSLLINDNKVHNDFAKSLVQFYNYSLDLAWKQIDPEEMKIVTKQAKDADSKGNK